MCKSAALASHQRRLKSFLDQFRKAELKQKGKNLFYVLSRLLPVLDLNLTTSSQRPLASLNVSLWQQSGKPVEKQQGPGGVCSAADLDHVCGKARELGQCGLSDGMRLQQDSLGCPQEAGRTLQRGELELFQ